MEAISALAQDQILHTKSHRAKIKDIKGFQILALQE